MIDRLADLRLFALIVERGSLTAASRELGLSQGAVSQRLSQLEKSAETQLLRRSTRRLQLTETGDQLYRTAKRAWRDDDLQSNLPATRARLKGAIRISAPLDLDEPMSRFGRRRLCPRPSRYR